MKPDLFIVGAPKCGTTAWYNYLRSHPDIYFPDLKEPHFFALDLPGFRRVTTEANYLSLFDDAGSATIRGEASVFYLYSELAAGEIARFNPDAKILIFLRSQEYSIPSFHQQLLFTFDDTLSPFEEAWRLSGRRPRESVPDTCQDEKILDYKSVGMFREQIKRYGKHFPEQQIRIIQFDDWVERPRETYLEILRFLGVADDGRTEFPRINEARFHNNRGLARFLQHPPKWILDLKNLLKKLVDRPSLGIADLIAKRNRTRGYSEKPSSEVQSEIREYYAKRQQIIAPNPKSPAS